MSRVALLDNWVMLFALLGFWFVLLDRGRHARRARATARRRRRGGRRDRHCGPGDLGRPWVIAAGVAFGAACAVKWSGLWFLAAFGDLPRRRRRPRPPPRRRAVLAHRRRAEAGPGHVPAARAGRRGRVPRVAGRAGSSPTAATTGTGPRGRQPATGCFSWVPHGTAEPLALPPVALHVPRRRARRRTRTRRTRSPGCS